MKVFSAEDSLFLNFTRAEEHLANESVQPLIKDQIAAALRRGKRWLRNRRVRNFRVE